MALRAFVTVLVALAVTAVSASSLAAARNTPCSGKKGGVVGCRGDKFLCRNGSLSKSKLTCSRAAEVEDPAQAEEDDTKALR